MNKYYAGIGSRETPQGILTIMHHLACYLYRQGWSLRSGGSSRADMAFEKGHDFMQGQLCLEPRKEIYLPWKGFNYNPSGLYEPFHEKEYEFAAQYHPAWDRCSAGARKLHARNSRIILGPSYHINPVKFIICYTDKGLIEGGTGQALRIAKDYEIPVINFGSARDNNELEKLIMEVEQLRMRYD